MAKFGAIAGLAPAIVIVPFTFFFSYVAGDSLSRLFSVFSIVIPVGACFIAGLLVAAVYNFLAPRFGGIEMEIVLKDKEQEL